MIQTFHHAGLEKYFLTGNTTAIPAPHAKTLRLILAVLHSAQSADDFNIPTTRLHRRENNRYRLQTPCGELHWQQNGGNIDALDYHPPQ